MLRYQIFEINHSGPYWFVPVTILSEKNVELLRTLADRITARTTIIAQLKVVRIISERTNARRKKNARMVISSNVAFHHDAQ